MVCVNRNDVPYEEECICGVWRRVHLWAKERMEKICNTIAGQYCIARETFSNCAKTLLEKGRRKYWNIMLKCPANCGKTFLLNPLNNDYKTFTNPASTSFAWVGVLFFKWLPLVTQIIVWHDLLLMINRGPIGSFAISEIALRSRHRVIYNGQF